MSSLPSSTQSEVASILEAVEEAVAAVDALQTKLVITPDGWRVRCAEYAADARSYLNHALDLAFIEYGKEVRAKCKDKE